MCGPEYDFWHSAQVDGLLTLRAIGVTALAYHGCRERRPGLCLALDGLLAHAFVIKYFPLVFLIGPVAALWVSCGRLGVGQLLRRVPELSALVAGETFLLRGPRALQRLPTPGSDRVKRLRGHAPR